MLGSGEARYEDFFAELARRFPDCVGFHRGYSEELWHEMAKLGWLGLPFPEEQGGAGLGLVELALVLDEMGRAAYPGPYFASVVLGGLGLMLGGSAAQKEKWLPAIASGQARASAALLEDGLDWDPAATAATATRAGDGWRLSGIKRFVPWAHVADVVLVPARAPEGLSLFLVDPRAAGVTLTPMVGIDLGNRWSELRLADAAVPADALVGSAGGASLPWKTACRRFTPSVPIASCCAALVSSSGSTWRSTSLGGAPGSCWKRSPIHPRQTFVPW